MLKIVSSQEPITVSQIVVTISGQPGVGKTSMGSTAEKSLLLDFDAGSHRSKFRRDVVRVSQWSDVEGITQTDLAPYKTIIVDTVGRALDFLSVRVMEDNPKHGYGGALTLQGYGALKARFAGWLNLIKSFGLDVVLLAHGDEQRKGDDIIERLDIQGGSKNEIYKSSDAMGRISIGRNGRTLNFNPEQYSFGKNPANIPVTTVPDYTVVPDFLAGIIDAIKIEINALSASQCEAANAIEEKRARWSAMKTAKEFNTVKSEMNGHTPGDEKILLVQIAKEKGFVLSEDKSQFVKAAK